MGFISYLTSGFLIADILLVSEKPSAFYFCCHGEVAIESSDDAQELPATDVRLVSYLSKVG